MMTPKMTREEAIARPTAQPPVGASKFLGSEPMEIDAGKGFARPSHGAKAPGGRWGENPGTSLSGEPFGTERPLKV